MLGRAKQVSFVGVSDLDAAQRFYGGILGLDLIDPRPFALVHDTPAGQIRITAVHEVRAAPYTVLGWALDDLEAEIDRLAAAGVDSDRHGGISQAPGWSAGPPRRPRLLSLRPWPLGQPRKVRDSRSEGVRTWRRGLARW